MSELPRIDPSWTRRRPHPEKDDTHLWAIFVSLCVGALAMWLFRAESELDTVREAAAAHSTALAKQALDRQHNEVVRRYAAKWLAEHQADRKSNPGSGASRDGFIHHCVSGSVDTYQLGECRAPLVDLGYAPRYPRHELQDQALTRARAEAQLRAEQQRFAALTGQTTDTWSPGYPTTPTESARQQCAAAKSERDRAYRLMGNERRFESIRYWDEVVYRACKNT